MPAPWTFVLLALASWRLWRLLAKDDLPPLPSLRNRLVGAAWSEERGEWVFGRPTLAYWLQCPFCSGFWVAFGVYAAWAAAGAPGHDPRGGWLSWLVVPFALSAIVGVIASRLDA